MKKPEVYTIHSSDSESELGKQKLFTKDSESSSSESECTMAKPDEPYEYNSPSESESDDQSHLSNYGAEDRDDEYFTKKGARKNKE